MALLLDLHQHPQPPGRVGRRPLRFGDEEVDAVGFGSRLGEGERRGSG